MMEVASIAIYGSLTKPSIWTEIIIAHQRKGKAMDALISRRAAIDAINEYMVGKRCDTDGTMMARLINELVIKQLPTIQPKRGRWHYSDGKPARIGLSFGVVCDQCGTESEYCTNFCGECGACFLRVGGCKQRIYMEQRPKYCPLVEIPTPHGRLGDLDKLKYDIVVGNQKYLGLNAPCLEDVTPIENVDDCIDAIAFAPTVIEAEGSEE